MPHIFYSLFLPEQQLLFVFFIVLIFLHFLLLAEVKLTFFFLSLSFCLYCLAEIGISPLRKTSLCLSVCLSVCLYTCLSVCLSVCLHLQLLEDQLFQLYILEVKDLWPRLFFDLNWNLESKRISFSQQFLKIGVVKYFHLIFCLREVKLTSEKHNLLFLSSDKRPLEKFYFCFCPIFLPSLSFPSVLPSRSDHKTFCL